MNRNLMAGKLAPRPERPSQLSAIQGDAPFGFLERPGRHRFRASKYAARPLAPVVGELYGMVSVTALQNSSFEQIRDGRGATVVSIGDDEPVRIVLRYSFDGRPGDTRVIRRAAFHEFSPNGILGFSFVRFP